MQQPSKADLERGYSLETDGIPPKEVKSPFGGTYPNPDRMTYGENGEPVDAFCGGFLSRDSRVED